MLLAIDIGNSQTSLGLFKGSELTHQWLLSTQSTRTPDELEAILFSFFQRHSLKIEEIRQVILCSVVPSSDAAYEHFVESTLKLPLYRVGITPKMPIQMEVDNPVEVGADRIANAIYAAVHFKLPALIIDIGTAITFDLVKRGPTYAGGLILPGMGLALQSLGGGTAKLPVVGLKHPTRLIGRNTIECIQNGIYFGYIEAIEGLICRFKVENLELAEVVLTGGGGELYKNSLKGTTAYHSDLTLHGIRLFYEKVFV